MKRIFGTPFQNYLPALGLMLFTACYLYLAAAYPPRARAFPEAVAWVMLGLLALDLVSRTQTRIGLALLRALNPAAEPGATHPREQSQRGSPVTAILWVAGLATALLLIGILNSVPLYIFASLRFRGERSLIMSLAIAAGATLLIWLLFGVVLRLNLYPGLFFDPQ